MVLTSLAACECCFATDIRFLRTNRAIHLSLGWLYGSIATAFVCWPMSSTRSSSAAFSLLTLLWLLVTFAARLCSYQGCPLTVYVQVPNHRQYVLAYRCLSGQDATIFIVLLVFCFLCAQLWSNTLDKGVAWFSWCRPPSPVWRHPRNIARFCLFLATKNRVGTREFLYKNNLIVGRVIKYFI